MFTIQCTNTKYEIFHLCVTVPSRFKNMLKNLDLKILKSSNTPSNTPNHNLKYVLLT